MNHNFSPAFQSWINEGTRPASAQSLSSLLDESRSALKSIISRIESGQIALASPRLAKAEKALSAAIVSGAQKMVANGQAVFNAADREALKANGGSIAALNAHRKAQASTPTAKASTPAPVATVKPSAAPVASSAVNAQSLAVAILDEQERREKASKIKTRAEFQALPPRERNEYIRSGGKLVD